jgi:hypothetical protein
VNFFPVTAALGLQIMASPMKGGNIKKIVLAKFRTAIFLRNLMRLLNHNFQKKFSHILQETLHMPIFMQNRRLFKKKFGCSWWVVGTG